MRVRLHKSSLVVGLGAAFLLLLVAIPGRVDDWSPGAFAKYEHGWPFVYLRRQTEQNAFATTAFANRREAQSQLPMFGIPWLSVANWKFWAAHDRDGTLLWDFNVRSLIADSVLVLLVLVTVVAVYEFRRRRREGLFRFNLLDMFVAITAVCAALGWIAHLKDEAVRETVITASFEKAQTSFVDDLVCVAPVWVKTLVGENWMPDFTWRARSVSTAPLDVEDIGRLCSDLSRLSYLNRFSLHGFLREDHFQYGTLRSLRQLQMLHLDTTARIDDRDLRELSQLSGLTKISLGHLITPDQLARLQLAMPNCQIVDADEDW